MKNIKDKNDISYIVPSVDRVFKLIFAAEGNEGLLKDFLESILEIKIDSLEVGYIQELIGANHDDKKVVLDVRAKLSDGTKVNIEVQNTALGYSDKRSLMYWSRLYSDGIQMGKKYKDLKKTICIWILNETCFPEVPAYVSKWQMSCLEYPEIRRFTEIEFHIIELQKFRESAKIKKSVRDFWLAFIDYTNGELVDMACSENNQIKTAQEELEKIRADEKEREIIFKELMESMDALERESIIKESERQMEENEKQKQENEMQKQENEMQRKANVKKEKELENSKKELENEKENLINSKKQLLLNLLKANMTVEQIAEITGFSKQEITKLTSEK